MFQRHATLAELIGEAIGLGSEATDEAIQTFEILRLCSEVIAGERFNELVKEYALGDSEFQAAEKLDVQTQQSAWVARDKVVGRVAESCFPHYAHLLAAERTYEAGGPHRWRCPIPNVLPTRSRGCETNTPLPQPGKSIRRDCGLPFKA